MVKKIRDFVLDDEDTKNKIINLIFDKLIGFFKGYIKTSLSSKINDISTNNESKDTKDTPSDYKDQK